VHQRRHAAARLGEPARNAAWPSAQAMRRQDWANRRAASPECFAMGGARNWILGDIGKTGAELLKCNCRDCVEGPGILPLNNAYFGLEADCLPISLSHGHPVNGSWSRGLNQGSTSKSRQRLGRCHGADVGVPIKRTW